MESSGPTGYDTIALVVAIVGLVLAVASLVWNFAVFRLSGPRIKVYLQFGARGPGGIATRRGPRQPDWGQLSNQGLDEPLVGVEVVNVGRAAIDVQRCNCRLSKEGYAYFDHRLPVNRPFPFRLEAHASESWWVPLGPVIGLGVVVARGQGSKERITARMEVETTGRRPVRTEPFEL